MSLSFSCFVLAVDTGLDCITVSMCTYIVSFPCTFVKNVLSFGRIAFCQGHPEQYLRVAFCYAGLNALRIDARTGIGLADEEDVNVRMRKSEPLEGREVPISGAQGYSGETG